MEVPLFKALGLRFSRLKVDRPGRQRFTTSLYSIQSGATVQYLPAGQTNVPTTTNTQLVYLSDISYLSILHSQEHNPRLREL